MFTTKISENTISICKLLFFKINLHFVTSNQIFTYRKLNLPLLNKIYLSLLYSRNAKKASNYQSLLQTFDKPLKETADKPLKIVAAKSFFSSPYVVSTTCFDECFSFYVVTGRHYFL